MNYKLIMLSPYKADEENLSLHLDKTAEAIYFDQSQKCLTFLESLNTPFILILSSKTDDIPYVEIMQECSKLEVIHNIIVFSSYGTIEEMSSTINNGAYDLIIGDNCFEQIITAINSIEEQNTISNKSNLLNNADHSLFLNILNNLKITTNCTELQSISSKYSNWHENEEKSLSSSKILIVEDEEIYLSFLRDMILPISPHSIFTVNNGTDAKKIIEQEKPSIILLDLFLPDIEGIEVLKFIKQVSPLSQVIIVTAFDLLDTAADVLKLGIFDYIRKPVLKKQLLNNINKAIYAYKALFLNHKTIHYFLSEKLTRAEKYILLELCIHQKSNLNKPAQLEDLFLFFPTLRDKNIPKTIVFPKYIRRQNIEDFVSSYI